LLAGSAVSQAEYIQHYGVDPGKIQLTRHGVDVDFFKPNSGGKAMRTRFGIGFSDPVILFAGFVTPRKGLEYLAKALPRMNPRPWLVIAGKWSLAIRQQFLTLIGPLAERVVEVGFVADEEMPACYGMADVYVSPSLMEGFGLPLAEALACGTPVVTAQAGAASEVVGPGGILVEPRDPDSLARAVSTLLGNEDLRRNLAIQGREHVIREFNLKRVVNTTIEAYQRFR
jgi:glycosyltransferase involved in cell wall biosynthesis